MKRIADIYSDTRNIAELIFKAGVESVHPSGLISQVMQLKDQILTVGDHSIAITAIENIYVIGAGKACAAMGAEVENILGPLIGGGHIIVKYGFSQPLSYIDQTEAGHPVPDSNGFIATKAILRLAEKAGPNDLVICLLSGGGSSLLADIPERCTSEEIISLNGLLVNSGASISEINAVRKHLSAIKGGQLARVAFPATLVTLVLSDVPGDRVDIIASGPTVPDPTTYQEAFEILRKYGLIEKLPPGIISYLTDGIAGHHPETPKEGDPVFNNTFCFLAGSNKTALDACAGKARELNLLPVIINNSLQGDVVIVAEHIVATALRFKNDANQKKPVCLLFGGEPSVRITGNGSGGRNQHLALLCSMLLNNIRGITILAAGTDGNDGTTDAAGAVVDSETHSNALMHNIDPEKYIRNFDSYNFFRRAGGHIFTGPTMTNVLDLIVVIIL